MARSLVLALGFSALVALPSGAAVATPANNAQATKQAAPAKITDDQLKDRIEHRLETDRIVRKYDVKVHVANAVATLSGDVATEAQKLEAGRVAHVKGISKVDNQIKVDKAADTTLADRAKNGLSKTGEAINDAWITTKVKWFFIGEDALKGSDINVDTTDHVVTLKGTVRSSVGRARAVELAKGTDGVKKVIDQLTISTRTTH